MPPDPPSFRGFCFLQFPCLMYTNMYVYIYMYVCMYLSMYASMYLSNYQSIYIYLNKKEKDNPGIKI